MASIWLSNRLIVIVSLVTINSNIIIMISAVRIRENIIVADECPLPLIRRCDHAGEGGGGGGGGGGEGGTVGEIPVVVGHPRARS